MSIRVARGAVVLGACVLWAACSKGESKADTTAATTTDTSAKMAAAPTPAPLTDANIVAILDEANAADSTWGAIGATKGTAASVKDFAKMMMRDHHALRKAGQDLAAKLNVTPAAPTGDTLPATLTKISDSLNAVAKGAAFDKAYIDHEVAYHQSVLAIATAAAGAAQDTSLKAFITKAGPNIQAHLTKAQDIDGKLGVAAAAAPAAASSDTGKKKP